MISYAIGIFYFTLICWLLTQNKCLRSNGVTGAISVIFFSLKCVAGFTYNYVALKYIPNRGDVWLFYEEGLQLYHTLLSSPNTFFHQLVQTFTITDVNVVNANSDIIRTVFEGLKFFQLILNLLSGGNFWTNTIIFNGLASFVFLKCWIFIHQYSGNKYAGAWLFLMPSCFFYTAGVHKEGIVFILIAVIIPLIGSIIGQAKPAKLIGLAVLCFLLLFFKFFVAVSFILAMIYWYLAEKFPKLKKWLLAALFFGTPILFFISAFTPINLLEYIANRQQEFLALPASSLVEVPVLSANMVSYVQAFPSAVSMAFFRPFLGEGGKAFYLVFTFEIYIFWLLFLCLIIWRIRKQQVAETKTDIKPLFVGLLYFGLINLIFIGYTVPNIGATMRYRSIFLPCVGCFLWQLLHGDLCFKNVINRLKQP